MTRLADLALTALAPLVWGSTYIVTTELLPGWHPLMVAMLRALPAGILLLLIVGRLPKGVWRGRAFVLGALNFSIFWALLFVAAYRLPGGVAATVGAIQPLIVLLLSRLLLGTPILAVSVICAVAGMAGVALMVLDPAAGLDTIGILAALGSAVSMAFGTVLTRKWQPDVPALTVTAWQLAAGGILLLPAALLLAPVPSAVGLGNLAALLWLGLAGAALTYLVWFRGIARLGPTIVAPLGLLSPASAIVLGWAGLGQALSPLQIAGIALVVGSILAGEAAHRSASGADEASRVRHRPAR
ncbi:EamA family transporter [Elioraea rosea]|uniref:EamA family transporter n=1 Tax=Elioraea rosea TaxID=2492390 RepID=UPI0011842FB1|nr:EamA family transporter [Elioraea rosea]